MAVEKVKGICGICPDKCDILATVEDGRLIKIEPDQEAPRGRLCPRGALAPEIIYHEKRILHPLIRTGERGSGQFREASFEEALDYAAEKIKEVVKNYGPDALVSYVGTAGREPSSMRCFGGKDAFFGHLGGINDRAFLVSPDAVMLDSVLRRRSDAASELLGADGPAAFAPHTNTPAESDEFEQAELF